MNSSFATFSLDDKYLVNRGNIFITGKQALVKVPLMQRVLDRKMGFNTAGFISGYRGSPLAGYDIELWKASKCLEQNDIVFSPGLNEDLAATSVWGTQQLGFIPGRKVEGVFAIWYGKGPGVDRSGDALRHLNLQGTEPKGGILLAFADDHPGKSSSTAHQSDQVLAAYGIPILYPASVAEIIEFGLSAFALSRFSGLAVGLKIVNETADASATIEVDIDSIKFVTPQNPPIPVGGVHIRKEFLAVQQQDARLVRYKIPLAQAFASANQLDKIVFGNKTPRFVIVTSGKAYPDVLAALNLLGIGVTEAERARIAVYKVGMSYPLEPSALKALAASADEFLFVEEKRPFIELQAASILSSCPRRQVISGKHDPDGRDLLPSDDQLDAVTVARAIAKRLDSAMTEVARQFPGIKKRAIELEAILAKNRVEIGSSVRRPTFCAGCPHSISTKVPEGSVGLTGIGCHSMVMSFPERNPLSVTHMGGEGATWIGMAPFTTTPHVFQNLGDGTYNHSGSLAVRAAVQADVTITYKILFNDAVAMTGGQPVEGGVSVNQMARQLLSEGVKKVVVVSDNPGRFRRSEKLPSTVTARHRDELQSVQEELRKIPGTTVLIYEQTCAAEKRRRKKRAKPNEFGQRAFINHLVCEGCGDCSIQSNCVAIHPLDTELGRKRVIDQSSCNEDLSCLKGFCPSFVTAEGVRLRVPSTSIPDMLARNLSDPGVPRLERYNIIVTGVGGTGVTTVSSILAMAGHLESHGASAYDMTGLSQKGGAVFSHIRLSRHIGTPMQAKIEYQEADLLIGCDTLATTQTEAFQTIDPRRTAVVLNDDLTPTLEFQQDRDWDLNAQRFIQITERSLGGRSAFRLAANSISTVFLGDSIASNIIMLGFAWQLGLIPLPLTAIESAIKLNGVSIPLNLEALKLGRIAASNPTGLQDLLAEARGSDAVEMSTSLEDFVFRRVGDLTAYQNESYAQRYQDLVQSAREAEARSAINTHEFSWAVARSAYHAMAYKDEYEVARLYTDGRFKASLERTFEPGYKLKFHFSPPLFSRRDPKTGRAAKISLGHGTFGMLKVLARLKKLRGTPFDIFGMTSDRRFERRLRKNCLETLRTLCAGLTSSNYGTAVRVAAAYQGIRGFGIIKHDNAEAVLAEIERDLKRFMEYHH